jgi:hypothetical protein
LRVEGSGLRVLARLVLARLVLARLVIARLIVVRLVVARLLAAGVRREIEHGAEGLDFGVDRRASGPVVSRVRAAGF